MKWGMNTRRTRAHGNIQFQLYFAHNPEVSGFYATGCACCRYSVRRRSTKRPSTGFAGQTTTHYIRVRQFERIQQNTRRRHVDDKIEISRRVTSNQVFSRYLPLLFENEKRKLRTTHPPFPSVTSPLESNSLPPGII